jgi:hypothetical protein
MDRSLPTTAHTPVTTFRDLMSISLVVVLAMFATATTARADVPLGTARTFAVLARPVGHELRSDDLDHRWAVPPGRHRHRTV